MRQLFLKQSSKSHFFQILSYLSKSCFLNLVPFGCKSQPTLGNFVCSHRVEFQILRLRKRAQTSWNFKPRNFETSSIWSYQLWKIRKIKITKIGEIRKNEITEIRKIWKIPFPKVGQVWEIREISTNNSFNFSLSRPGISSNL